MATSFQPEDPHPDSKHGRSSGSLIWLAVLGVLAILVVVFVLIPRF
jgi:hypothetical protein